MISSLQTPIAFGLIASSMTTFGLFAVSVRDTWTLRNANLFGLVAAGMLCTLTFLHILPESFALAADAPAWLTLGFFGGLVLNFLIQSIFPDTQERNVPREAITPILAIAIHSFIDGVIYTITFTASVSSGVFAALSLIMHEFPEGVIAYAILRRYGVSNRRAFLFAFLAAALTTPLGVLVAEPFVQNLGTATIGALFALSAGLLLFVATGPLLAPLKEVQPERGLAALLGGVGISLLLLQIPFGDHSHDHSHDGHDHSEPHSHGGSPGDPDFRTYR